MNKGYIGHSSQISGVEEHRLVGGKGDGSRLFIVRNGKGLEFTVTADRGADISRLSFKGDNYTYMNVGGYANPEFYDESGVNWLRHMQGGLVATCGLTNVGIPVEEDGVLYPLHGRINYIPAESVCWDEDDEEIRIKAKVNHAFIFEDKFMMERMITTYKEKNELLIEDTVTNYGDTVAPFEMMYHMNFGYPLLSENTEVWIPSDSVTPRNERAAEDLDTWFKVNPPTPGFVEQVYFHKFNSDIGRAAMFQPDLNKGVLLTFDARLLDNLSQWRMNGIRDYVMGLEPANCTPDGRVKMREDGILKFLNPGQSIRYWVRVTMVDGVDEWEKIKRG